MKFCHYYCLQCHQRVLFFSRIITQVDRLIISLVMLILISVSDNSNSQLIIIAYNAIKGCSFFPDLRYFYEKSCDLAAKCTIFRPKNIWGYKKLQGVRQKAVGGGGQKGGGISLIFLRQ